MSCHVLISLLVMADCAWGYQVGFASFGGVSAGGGCLTNICNSKLYVYKIMKSCPELTSKANYLQVSVNCSLSKHHQKAQTCLMNAIIPYESLVFPQRAFAYILFLFLVCKKCQQRVVFWNYILHFTEETPRVLLCLYQVSSCWFSVYSLLNIFLKI